MLSARFSLKFKRSNRQITFLCENSAAASAPPRLFLKISRSFKLKDLNPITTACRKLLSHTSEVKEIIIKFMFGEAACIFIKLFFIYYLFFINSCHHDKFLLYFTEKNNNYFFSIIPEPCLSMISRVSRYKNEFSLL